MTIDAAGFGTFEWRIYRFCGQSPPPCDLFIGNLIIDGGHAKFSATLRAPNLLSGDVVATTEAQAVPLGHFTARLRPGVNILDLMIGSENLAMCGPRAPTPNDCGA